jgi:outer membrane protein assembly factor BamB
MSCVLSRRALLSVLAIGLAISAPGALAAVPSWTTYRRDAIRSGVDPDSTSPVTPSQAWQTPVLDGQIYGQPLVYGSTVYVATENDTVYALDASNGDLVWQHHLATAVPASELPCGDIDPVGITSTPVIDPSTGAIYVVADTWDGSNQSSIAHKLFGLRLATGAEVAGLPEVVDPPVPASVSTPPAQLQRAALALDGSEVVIGYGGNAGDCGTYHGWLVGVPETGGPLKTFEVEPQPGENAGAIWGSGNGPVIDSAGDIWTSTGNGFGSTFGYQESVVKLDPELNLLDFWAPVEWPSLDMNDLDLGSSDPVLLPGGLVFQIGKQGVGYLLSASNPGGENAPPLFSASVCNGSCPASACGGSWGGGVYDDGVIYVACSNGLYALSLNGSKFAPLSGWSVPGDAIGPPIVAGGLVWSASYNSGTLYGINPQTGAVTYSDSLGSFDHFASPSAAGGRLFVANGDQVTAFTIANRPPPSTTATGLASSQNPVSSGAPVSFTATVGPVPDAGTVSFTDAGTPIAGCAAVSISAASGPATCTTSFAAAGTHTIDATYSGDAYYVGSSSLPLSQVVQAGPGGGSPGSGSPGGSPTGGSSPAGSSPSSGSPPPAPRFSYIVVRLVHGRVDLRMLLSEAATISVGVERRLLGRVVGGRCSPGRRAGHRCRVWIMLRTLKLHATRGTNSFVLRTKRLRRGRYRLSLVARDRAGRSSPRTFVTFMVPAQQH